MAKKDKIKTDDRFILEQNKQLPRCIICDIDGTIALINGRYVYNDSAVITDKVNIPIKNILYDYQELGIEVIFLSGRMNTSRKVTEEWLKANNMWFTETQKLYMRETNDYRKDDIVKMELYQENIKDKYYVDFILDDRNQVVKMWRSLGLLCLQVYYGDF